MRFTSYELRWRRKHNRPRPDFSTQADLETYIGPDGTPLFSVMTYPGVPSEGIFTLIAEAPRLRDELDAGGRR